MENFIFCGVRCDDKENIKQDNMETKIITF